MKDIKKSLKSRPAIGLESQNEGHHEIARKKLKRLLKNSFEIFLHLLYFTLIMTFEIILFQKYVFLFEKVDSALKITFMVMAKAKFEIIIR